MLRKDAFIENFERASTTIVMKCEKDQQHSQLEPDRLHYQLHFLQFTI